MIYYVELFDYYGELFTEKQKAYFMDYYFNNLSLQEIAENNGVSRNAVHKNLKEIIKKLDFYEEKLNLYKNKQKIIEILKKEKKDLIEKIEELI